MPEKAARMHMFIMHFLLLLLATIPIATAQFTTPMEGTKGIIVTSVSVSIPEPSIAVYTPSATTIESWLCATKNLSDYLKPPMPTGELLEIYYDYSDTVNKECEDKIPKPFTTFPACPSIAKARWCAVSNDSFTH